MSKTPLEQELARIPSEYQEVFRETLNRELKEAGQDLTEQDTLSYLRRRMEDLRRGDFIRPDGKTGTTTLETTELWSPAVVSEIAQDVEGKPAARQRERRRTVIKGGALLLVAVIFVLVVANGRRQRTAQAAALEATAEGTATSPAAAAEGINPLLPPPTPTLTTPGSADDALQTIGGLGGSLTLGRPGALEIRYMATEETVALPIDPARVSNKGEMPFNAATMASDNPVAVWVFGTVLNYAIGLPENLVTALQPGDRLRLSTDTGFALPFIVTQTERRASHEAGDLLSQNRVGMTLFALPARSADAVPVALAAYDLTGEDAQTAVYREVGEPFFPGGDLKLTAVSFSDSRSGELMVTLEGTGHGSGMLAVHARSHQTTAVALPAGSLPAEDSWQMTFLLPANVADTGRAADTGGATGEPLTAVYRQLPGGESAFIRLGDAPNLLEQLDVGEPRASWQAATGEMVVTVTVTNPGPGLVRLPGDYMQIPNKGGDAYESGRLMDQLLEAGETYQVRLAFPHPGPAAPFMVQIGQWLWGAGREVNNEP